MPFLVAQASVAGVPGPDLVPPVWRTLVGLVIVLALVAGLAWLMRRGLLGRRKNPGLGVESALALGERRSLVVVTVEGRRLLLGLAPNNVTLVTELQSPRSFERTVTDAVATTERA